MCESLKFRLQLLSVDKYTCVLSHATVSVCIQTCTQTNHTPVLITIYLDGQRISWQLFRFKIGRSIIEDYIIISASNAQNRQKSLTRDNKTMCHLLTYTKYKTHSFGDVFLWPLALCFEQQRDRKLLLNTEDAIKLTSNKLTHVSMKLNSSIMYVLYFYIINHAYVYGRIISWMQNKVDFFQLTGPVALAERGDLSHDGSNNDLWGEFSIVSGNGRESDRRDVHFVRPH